LHYSFELHVELRGPLFVRKGSHHSSSGHEIEDEYDDCENQKDVDPSAQRVTADKSHDPEDEKNDGDCPKHISFS
jgi:hypothetical protein